MPKFPPLVSHTYEVLFACRMSEVAFVVPTDIGPGPVTVV
jgi:hypothetical protein